ncbi:ribose-5-phosphate isomerase-like [Schistocerca gregaria]|uniref:ribose-5-phosphate isomerase-like n=1 Tax=Schistocerca gregaria TaxID=7010 RepID=UPI00211DFF4E|nr:ribose-5-phosphate isomerase-like [Schistocerca gregaria]
MFEEAKRAAARLAVDECIKDKMVIGIGSGTTVIYAVQRLRERVEKENLDIACIPTSFQSRHLILENGLHLSSLEQHPEIDVTIDGADEIDARFNLIKGGGGCCTQEKIVAAYSKQLVIIADSRKKSTYLGQKWKKGIPIEVLPSVYVPVINKLVYLGGVAKLRSAVAKVGPVITDNGNLIIDAEFGVIEDPGTLERKLKEIVGIVETGLFIDMASEVYFGNVDGSITHHKSRTGEIV